MVGRNGIFYDRKGRDYDATITKIVANPISLRQAFWLPYKKFVRMMEEQVAKRAAAADAAATDKLASAAAATANAGKGPVEERKVDVGTVAALGVAFGAVGTFFTALASGAMQVVGLGPFAIVGALIALVSLISGPSMILAYIKLRKRNLGPILDANGWALNAMATVNVPLGGSLTKEAELPEDSERDLSDPFAEEPHPWRFYLFVLVLLGLAFGWYVGKLDQYLPLVVRSVTVLGENAPAYVAPERAAAAPTQAAPAPTSAPAAAP
jgi:hypothetical protein